MRERSNTTQSKGAKVVGDPPIRGERSSSWEGNKFCTELVLPKTHRISLSLCPTVLAQETHRNVSAPPRTVPPPIAQSPWISFVSRSNSTTSALVVPIACNTSEPWITTKCSKILFVIMQTVILQKTNTLTSHVNQLTPHTHTYIYI